MPSGIKTGCQPIGKEFFFLRCGLFVLNPVLTWDIVVVFRKQTSAHILHFLYVQELVHYTQTSVNLFPPPLSTMPINAVAMTPEQQRGKPKSQFKGAMQEKAGGGQDCGRKAERKKRLCLNFGALFCNGRFCWFCVLAVSFLCLTFSASPLAAAMKQLSLHAFLARGPASAGDDRPKSGAESAKSAAATTTARSGHLQATGAARAMCRLQGGRAEWPHVASESELGALSALKLRAYQASVSRSVLKLSDLRGISQPFSFDAGSLRGRRVSPSALMLRAYQASVSPSVLKLRTYEATASPSVLKLRDCVLYESVLGELSSSEPTWPRPMLRKPSVLKLTTDVASASLQFEAESLSERARQIDGESSCDDTCQPVGCVGCWWHEV